MLYQIKECKYEYPNEVYKVPVQTNLRYHLIVASALQNTNSSLIENDEVQNHPTKYVETVETCDKEEQCSEVWRTILIDCQIGTIEDTAI